MSENKESPEERRERLRQQDIRENASSAYSRGGLQDLVGGLSWKATGMIVLVLILGFVIYNVFFR
ncbi:DUF6366 family protein [Piscibacillus halophilus]|uniref:DUF6366 family protein n=1 Tax=Piscibacillus halophilus TaxID=571933 RepID=UPI00240A5262|nr:DUF6366 family protein [Piscibacillus halophilus]